MGLGHEKLDVYRLSIGYVAWVFEKVDSLKGAHRSTRDQWLRASQSIPLNIAEGNGKTAEDSAPYASEDPDFDSDFDNDFEENRVLQVI
jgi:hypothetical protein